MPTILITCYVSPDLDGYAGAVAYAELLNQQGINTVAGVIDLAHDEVKYVLKRFNLAPAEAIINDDAFTQVILVDASDINGLEGKIKPEKVIEVIDHRQINEADKFIKAKVQIELVGAAATLITEKYMLNNSEISSRSAILLYSAIISNTLNFKGGVTTERDIKAADWLKKYITVGDDYWQELFLAKSNLSGENLEKRIEGDFAWFELGDKKIGVAQLEIIGAGELINNRLDEIISILDKIKTDLHLDHIFQNTIELDKGINYLISDDKLMQIILESALEIKFDKFVAKRTKLIMRKQIVPLIKTELEKNMINQIKVKEVL